MNRETRLSRDWACFRLNGRNTVFLLVWAAMVVTAVVAQGPRTVSGADGQISTVSGSPNFTIPETPPQLLHPEFECSTGYYPAFNRNGEAIFVPDDWQLLLPEGAPIVHSARVFFETRANNDEGGCDTDFAHVERIGERDSVVFRAENLFNPFDAVLYQQVAATPGGAYSVSGWFLSLCGGSDPRSRCPEDKFMAKALGIDPYGGTDPQDERVVWVENLDNFVSPDGKDRIGWQNLRTSAIAQSMTVTVYARINSPFEWSGNHAFVDSLSMVRAPVAEFGVISDTVSGGEVELVWDGLQSPDAAAVPGGTYELLFDVQARYGDGDWVDLLTGERDARALSFRARCTDTSYDFRIRARSEQPVPDPDNGIPEGVWPNQRYPGVWSEAVSVFFEGTPLGEVAPVEGEFSVYLPTVTTYDSCL